MLTSKLSGWISAGGTAWRREVFFLVIGVRSRQEVWVTKGDVLWLGKNGCYPLVI